MSVFVSVTQNNRQSSSLAKEQPTKFMHAFRLLSASAGSADPADDRTIRRLQHCNCSATCSRVERMPAKHVARVLRWPASLRSPPINYIHLNERKKNVAQKKREQPSERTKFVFNETYCSGADADMRSLQSFREFIYFP